MPKSLYVDEGPKYKIVTRYVWEIVCIRTFTSLLSLSHCTALGTALTIPPEAQFSSSVKWR